MKILVAGLLAGVLACTQVEAQLRPPQPLDLQSAVNWALENNFSVRSADLRVAQLGGERQHANRLTPSNPELGLSLADRTGPDGSSTDFGIEISQEIWIAGQRGLNQRAAQSRLDAARSEAGFFRTTIAARVRQAFLGALLAREAVATAGRASGLADRLSDIAQKRLDRGAATRLELNAALTGEARAQIELLNAQRNRVQAELHLAQLLGVEVEHIADLEGDLYKLSGLEIPDMDYLLQQTAERRQDLLATASRIAAADAELQLAKRELIPNLRVAGFYEEEEDFEILGAKVGIELPLFHSYVGERKQAMVELQLAENDRQALLLRIRREIAQAVSDYQYAVSAVDLLGDQALAQAEQSVELTRRAFSAGEISASGIISAQNALLAMREAYLSALAGSIRAATDLERASGGLLVLTSNLGSSTDSGGAQ